MLRARHAGPVLERLQWLKEHEIQFHTQLVIVPGWNDKENMEKSIEDLMGLYPSTLSISIVPVGLTSHRQKLVRLNSFTGKDASDCLERLERYIASCKERFGTNLVFPSDEVYLLAGADIPPSTFYGDYSQYENGVGMIRALVDEFERELPDLPDAPEDWEVTVLSGASAAGVIQNLLLRLEKEKGLRSETIVCENLTFGSEVTVTGLLCGRDFLEAVKKSCLKGPVLIPPGCLNREKIFLDDLSPGEMEKQCGRKVLAPGSFRDFFPQ
jgi:NifB/MoaA-like Fe-S oxidoreductase